MKTDYIVSKMEEREAVFQFLIGKMKTSISCQEKPSISPFQFLIGKMKTVQTYLFVIYLLQVSIPHR